MKRCDAAILIHHIIESCAIWYHTFINHVSLLPSSSIHLYLTTHAHSNTQSYPVLQVSPQKTPQVVGKLLDLECAEDFIKNLLNSVGQLCPVAELVEQVISN